MEAIVRTVYGAYVQTCLLTGVAQQFHENTTLNEKFGILASTLPTQTDRSKLGYYTVGNRGHRNVTGAEGRQKTEPVQHLPTDAALYGHMPLVMRRLTEDLTAAERARYALRKEESHAGEMYAKYYLRRLDMTNVIPSMEYKTVQDGVETTTPFVPNSSNLNPTPPTVANTGTNLIDGDYVQASARLTLSISEQEAAELLNVAKILYDDEGFAIISELALCTGVDKVVPVTTGAGSSFNMNEAIGVQIAAFVPGMYPMVFNNTGLEITLDVGASEPLFNLL